MEAIATRVDAIATSGGTPSSVSAMAFRQGLLFHGRHVSRSTSDVASELLGLTGCEGWLGLVGLVGLVMCVTSDM